MTNEELRPLTIGQIFDKTFKLAMTSLRSFALLYLAYFGVVIGLTLLSNLILSLVARIPFWDAMLGRGMEGSISAQFVYILTSYASSIVSGLIQLVVYSIMTDLFIKLFLNEEWSFGDSIGRIGKKVPVILVAGVLAFIIAFAGIFGCGIGVIVTSIFVSFFIPAIVFENRGIGGAINRSFKLVSYNFWGILGSYLLGGLILFGVAMIFYAVVIGVIFLLGFSTGGLENLADTLSNISDNPNMIVPLIIAGIIAFVFYMLIVIFYTALSFAFNVTLFFNQKIRYENFGLERMAEAFSMDNADSTGSGNTIDKDDSNEEPPQYYT